MVQSVDEEKPWWKRYMTLKEVASLFLVHPRTVRRRVEEKKFPAPDSVMGVDRWWGPDILKLVREKRKGQKHVAGVDPQTEAAETGEGESFEALEASMEVARREAVSGILARRIRSTGGGGEAAGV